MRVNRTYSLDYDTIKDLNATISAKHRSRYVDKAIQRQLNGYENLDLTLIETRRLMAVMLSRDDVPEHIKVLLLQEMNS